MLSFLVPTPSPDGKRLVPDLGVGYLRATDKGIIILGGERMFWDTGKIMDAEWRNLYKKKNRILEALGLEDGDEIEIQELPTYRLRSQFCQTELPSSVALALSLDTAVVTVEATKIFSGI